MPFDLYEVRYYENETVAYNKIEANNPSESIDSITAGGEIEQVSKEVKSYSIEDHFKEGWEKSRDLFDILDERILELDPNLHRDPKKVYIGYKIDNSVVLSLVSYKSKIKVELYRVKPKELIDPENRATYQKNSYKFYGKHVTEFDVTEEEDIDYAMMLIKQVYKKFVGQE